MGHKESEGNHQARSILSLHFLLHSSLCSERDGVRGAREMPREREGKEMAAAGTLLTLTSLVTLTCLSAIKRDEVRKAVNEMKKSSSPGGPRAW